MGFWIDDSVYYTLWYTVWPPPPYTHTQNSLTHSSQSGPVQLIAAGLSQHSRSWFPVPLGTMTMFLFFPDLYVFSSGASFLKRGSDYCWSLPIYWGVTLLALSHALLSPRFSHSQNHFTTYGLQPISSSLHQASWDPQPVFFFSTELLWL
jgi:hypothetical protein